MRRARSLVVGPAPYVYRRQTTASLMWGTVAALSPAVAWGLYSFGARAAVPLLAAIGAALAGEAAIAALSKRFTLLDGSAFLTGLLIGMAMPPNISPIVPAASALFAVIAIKGAFGGLGSNWMNPALGGIAFALLNWPRSMNAWMVPRQVADAVSAATPLGILRDRLASAPAGSNTLDILVAGGMRFTDFDRGSRRRSMAASSRDLGRTYRPDMLIFSSATGPAPSARYRGSSFSLHRSSSSHAACFVGRFPRLSWLPFRSSSGSSAAFHSARDSSRETYSSLS